MRFAIRTLLKHPGFAALAIVTVAAAMAITVGNFVFASAILLEGTPVPDSNRLVMLIRSSAQVPEAQTSPADYKDLSSQSSAFQSIGCYTGENPVLEDPFLPAENFTSQAVSGAFFQVFSVRPILGRVIDESDQRPGTDLVFVLSERFWRRRFNADPSIIGRTIRVDGRPATVVGVMPTSFDNPLLWGRVDAWQPLAFDARRWSNRTDNELRLVGRLRPGISLQQAQSEVDTLGRRLAKDNPENDGEATFRLADWDVMRQGGMRTHELEELVVALGAFVLLIAGANLANLCLARSADRLHDYAVRFALGSSLGNVFRQAVVEGLLVATLGGIFGLIGAHALVVCLQRYFTIGSQTGLIDFEFDGQTWILAGGIVALATVVQAVAPLILITRLGPLAALKSGGHATTIGRSGQRLRHALVAIELGLSLILVAGAGFCVRALGKMAGQDLGWQPNGILTAGLVLPNRPPYSSHAGRDNFIRRLEPELAQLPGIKSVAVSHQTPFRYWTRRTIAIEGRPLPRPGTEPFAFEIAASSGYFATFGIRLESGRLFSAQDQRQAPPVALIDEAMARTFWPGASPIGQRFRYTEGEDQREIKIVGVVVEAHSPIDAVAPPLTHFQIYRPWFQDSGSWMNISVRCSGPPEALENALRKTIFYLDPALPLSSVCSLRLEIDNLIGGGIGLVAKILGAFTVVGLCLAAVGVYGVVTTFVAQRTREIGIRMALGATDWQVARLVLSRTLAVAVAGAAVGTLGAIAVLRVLGTVWPAVEGSVGTMISGVAILVATGVGAAWVPVRRATLVDPIVALRSE